MKNLVDHMIYERANNIRGIYWLLQIQMAYNSNRIEGSRLTAEHTESLFDSDKIIAQEREEIRVSDIKETENHFRAFDFVIDTFDEQLNAAYLKQLHKIIKSGFENEPYASVGEFKQVDNIIGDAIHPIKTTPKEKVAEEIDHLLFDFQMLDKPDFEGIVAFHYLFEKIHPFADGNGRVGRLLVFKECLRHHFIPAIINEQVAGIIDCGQIRALDLSNRPHQVVDELTEECMSSVLEIVSTILGFYSFD